MFKINIFLQKINCNPAFNSLTVIQCKCSPCSHFLELSADFLMVQNYSMWVWALRIWELFSTQSWQKWFFTVFNSVTWVWLKSECPVRVINMQYLTAVKLVRLQYFGLSPLQWVKGGQLLHCIWMVQDNKQFQYNFFIDSTTNHMIVKMAGSSCWTIANHQYILVVCVLWSWEWVWQYPFPESWVPSANLTHFTHLAVESLQLARHQYVPKFLVSYWLLFCWRIRCWSSCIFIAQKIVSCWVTILVCWKLPQLCLLDGTAAVLKCAWVWSHSLHSKSFVLFCINFILFEFAQWTFVWNVIWLYKGQHKYITDCF